MRILYHHRTLADGAEGIHIQEMVEAFRSLGHDVTIHALAASSSTGHGSGTLAAVKSLVPKSIFELAALAYNAVELVTVWRSIRSSRPDLLYKRHAIFDVAALMAARGTGVPVILEVNAAYSSGVYQDLEGIRFRRLGLRCERLSVKTATLVAAVSSPLRDLLMALAPGSNHIIVLPNGANPGRFSTDPPGTEAIRATFGSPSEVVVGWSGILRDWHGLDLLVGAIRRASGLRLVVIGDGPDRARIQALVRESGVAGRTMFTGRVPHDKMPAYLAALDIAVAADDRTGYASPMKVLEYMAAGRPVVAPRLAGIQDIIDEEIDGILFTRGSEAELTAALIRLAADSDLRQQLGRRARLKVERERNWQRIAQIALDRLRAVSSGRSQSDNGSPSPDAARPKPATRRAGNRTG